jgi:hypothetical protein
MRGKSVLQNLLCSSVSRTFLQFSGSRTVTDWVGIHEGCSDMELWRRQTTVVGSQEQL